MLTSKEILIEMVEELTEAAYDCGVAEVAGKNVTICNDELNQAFDKIMGYISLLNMSVRDQSEINALINKVL